MVRDISVFLNNNVPEYPWKAGTFSGKEMGIVSIDFQLWDDLYRVSKYFFSFAKKKMLNLQIHLIFCMYDTI